MTDLQSPAACELSIRSIEFILLRSVVQTEFVLFFFFLKR